ncbi:MAG: glycosyltransferase family 39 protein, partial [Planctomycetota bacterium]|nr:glycosyltransferase family 39 protein [Planctomycetota bacterium]
MAGERSERGHAFDLAVALLLAVLFGALYGLTFQERMLGDGAGLATMYAHGESFAHHLLYLPACRLVSVVMAGGDPIAPTRFLSVLAAGLGCSFTWLLTRALGAPRPGALAASLLLGLSPGLWFFGTTVEVHALHFLAVALAAWGVLVAPWERTALALALTCVLFALAFLAHQLVVLLAPGWLLLVHHARARRAEAFPPRTLLLVVAPSLAAAVLAALAISNLARTGSLLFSAEHELGFLAAFQRPWHAGWMWSDGVLPLLFLIPAAAWAALKAKSSAAHALLALILAPIAFLSWWGVPEHGGYALGHAPFLAALAAFAFPSDIRRAALIAAPLVAVQAFAAHATIAAFDTGWKVEERVAQVRDL